MAFFPVGDQGSYPCAWAFLLALSSRFGVVVEFLSMFFVTLVIISARIVIVEFVLSPTSLGSSLDLLELIVSQSFSGFTFVLMEWS